MPPGVTGLPAEPAPAGEGRFVLAAWWARAAAFVLDGLVVVAVAALLAWLAGGVLLSLPAPADADVLEGLGWVVVAIGALLIAVVLYAPTVLALSAGHTLGKLALGLRVVRSDGRTLGYGGAMLREVVVKGLLIGVVGLLTLGILWVLDALWPLWDAERRALHDLICRTRVVRAVR